MREIELRDDEYTVEPDELELVESGVRLPLNLAHIGTRGSTPPPPPAQRTQTRRERTAEIHALALSITARTTGAAGAQDFKVGDLQAELTRLRRQMRARDAYLAELERALADYDALLAQAGLHGLDDLAGLLGRVRGQAYRIAELELSLRDIAAAQRLQLAKPNKTAAVVVADKVVYSTRTKSSWNKPAAAAAAVAASRTSRVSTRAHAAK